MWRYAGNWSRGIVCTELTCTVPVLVYKSSECAYMHVNASNG
jgi:hypothetical protein